MRKHYDHEHPEEGFGKEPRRINISPLPESYYSRDLGDKSQFRFDHYLKEQNEKARKEEKKLQRIKYGSRGGM